MHCGDRLRARELRHPLCIGLDPHLPHIPLLLCRGTMAPVGPQTAAVVDEVLTCVLERWPGIVVESRLRAPLCHLTVLWPSVTIGR